MKPLTINNSGVFALPEDGVFQMWPRGEWPIALDMLKSGLNAFGTPERVAIQVVDDVALAAMAANPPTGKATLIDYEHFSSDPEKSSEAAGWIESLIAADDGLNFTARWSDGGMAALLGGRYRFISPVAPPEGCEVLSHNPLRIRPLQIRTAGLTNDPNLRGRPLSNRRENPAANQETQKGNRTMLKPETITAILAAIGLPPESTDEQVMAELPGCENKVKCYDGLKNRHDALLADQVDGDLTKYATVISVDAKPKWKAALLANRESTLALLDGIATPAAVEEPGKPLTNRAAAKNPTEGSEDAKTKKAEARAGAIRNRAAELRKTNPRMSLATAYAAAEEEIEAKIN